MEQETTLENQATVQETHYNAPLTSSEIARLWRSNSYYSMLRCVYRHLMNTLDDPILRTYFEDPLSMFETRINQTGEILRMEGQPVPKVVDGDTFEAVIDLGFTFP